MKITNQNSQTHRGKKKNCLAGASQQLSPITVGPQLKKSLKEE